MTPVTLGTHTVGPGYPPLVIAEMSGNHGHDLDKALRLVDAAAKAGAHALKLQTYTADTMTLDLREGDFLIDDPHSLWAGHTLYDLYKKAYTPWEWHAPIFERARQLGMLAFSTPFDATAVDYLETLNVPCFKIASFENGDLPLIRRVAATGRPLIMSTGTATLDELSDAVQAAREGGCCDLILLKCTSHYPARPDEANLQTLSDLQARFGCPVGLSDHTLGTVVSVAATALGACIIEKHVTLNRGDGDIDAAFSLEPHDLSRLTRDVQTAWASIGRINYTLSESEQQSRRHRRGLYVVRDINAGELLTPDNIRSIRPGAGLPPKHLETILGRRAVRDIPKGTPLDWTLVA